MVGTITAAGNVSKGIVTTTSTFAPRILEVDFVRTLVPYRLELKDRKQLLEWLARLLPTGTQPNDQESQP